MADGLTKDDLLELLRNARGQCLVLQRQLADCADMGDSTSDSPTT